MHIQERIWEPFERPSFSPPRPDEDTTHRTWAWAVNRHRWARPFAFPKFLIGEREKAVYGKEKENEGEAQMKFAKEFLQDDGGEKVYDKIIGRRRWSLDHERVFKHEGRYFRTRYSIGATENQDEQPYEHEDDEIECVEVFPVEKKVIVYEETQP